MKMSLIEQPQHVVCSMCELGDLLIIESEYIIPGALETRLEKTRCQCGSYYNDFTLEGCNSINCGLCQYVKIIYNRVPRRYYN